MAGHRMLPGGTGFVGFQGGLLCTLSGDYALLAQLVGKYGGALQLTKVEVDVGENMKLAGRYRVRDFIRQHGGI